MPTRDLSHIPTEELQTLLANLESDKQVLGIGPVNNDTGKQIKQINEAIAEINRTIKARGILAKLGYEDKIEMVPHV